MRASAVMCCVTIQSFEAVLSDECKSKAGALGAKFPISSASFKKPSIWLVVCEAAGPPQQHPLEQPPGEVGVLLT